MFLDGVSIKDCGTKMKKKITVKKRFVVDQRTSHGSYKKLHDLHTFNSHRQGTKLNYL